MKIYNSKNIITLITGFSLLTFSFSCNNPTDTNKINNNIIQNTNIIKVSDYGADLSFDISTGGFSVKDNSNGTTGINKYIVYLLANTASAGYPSGGDPLADTVAGPFTISSAGLSNIRLTGVPSSPTSPNKYYYIALKAQDSGSTDLIKPNNAGIAWGGASANQPIAVSSGAGISVSSTLVVSPTTALNTTINLLDGIGGATLEANLSSAGNFAPIVNSAAFENEIVIQAELRNPNNVTADASGNLYVADASSNSIKKIDTLGNVTTFVSDLPSPPSAVTVSGTDLFFGLSGSVNKTAVAGGPYVRVAYYENSPALYTGTPYDIEVSGTTLYFSDTANNAIKKCNTTPQASTVTNVVTGLSGPKGIAIYNSGSNIAFTDSTNFIKTVPSSGGTVTTIPVTGSLNSPDGIASSGTNLYFTEIGSNSVKRVATTGGTISLTYTTGGTGSPKGIALFGTNLYFVDSLSNSVKRVPEAGGTITTLVPGIINSPQGIALSGTDIYFADTKNNAIKKVSTSGTGLTTITNTGLSSPTGIALSGTDIYFTDTGNNAIKKVTTSGTGLTTITNTGLSGPTGIALSGTDIYFTDTGNNAIKKVTTSGTGLTTITNTGLSGPKGIVLSGTNIYFTDTGNNAIKKVTTSGTGLTTITNTGLSNPTGIFVSGSDICFADTGNNALKKVAISGGIVSTLMTGLNAPGGIVKDSSGYKLYVSNTNENSIVVLK